MWGHPLGVYGGQHHRAGTLPWYPPQKSLKTWSPTIALPHFNKAPYLFSIFQRIFPHGCLPRVFQGLPCPAPHGTKKRQKLTCLSLKLSGTTDGLVLTSPTRWYTKAPSPGMSAGECLFLKPERIFPRRRSLRLLMVTLRLGSRNAPFDQHFVRY